MNIVLLSSWESQPWKAKSKPLTPTALVWCIVLLSWKHMTNGEIRSNQRDKLLATEMMGKRLLCQEEKLKFLSSGKEDEACLARVSVPSINISPTIAAPQIRINPDKAPWSSPAFQHWIHELKAYDLWSYPGVKFFFPNRLETKAIRATRVPGALWNGLLPLQGKESHPLWSCGVCWVHCDTPATLSEPASLVSSVSTPCTSSQYSFMSCQHHRLLTL